MRLRSLQARLVTLLTYLVAVAAPTATFVAGWLVSLPVGPNAAPIVSPFGFNVNATTAGLVAGLIGIVLTVWLTPGSVARLAELNRLRQSVSRGPASIEAVAEANLALLAERLRYASDERVTVLVPAKEPAMFKIVARFSPIVRWRQDRTDVPRSRVGWIWQAWDTGQAVEELLPETGDIEGWSQVVQDRWEIPADVAAAFAMKSRTIVAVRIEMPGPTRPPIGVLVLETIRPAGDKENRELNPAAIIKWVKQNEEDRLTTLLQAYGDLSVAAS